MPELTRFLGLTETINGEGRTVFIIGRVESHKPQQFFFPHRLWATIWQVWYEPATEEKVVCPRCKGRRKIYRKTIGCWLCQGSRFFTTQKSLKLAVKRFGDNGNVTEFWLPPDSQKLSRRVDCNVGRFFATLTLCSSPKFIVSDSDPWVLWRNKQRTRRRCCKPWNSRVLPKT